MGLDFDALEYCKNVKSKQLLPPYICPVSKCGRNYKTIVGLQYHLLNYDHDNPQPTVPVMASSRKKSRSRGSKHHHNSTYKGGGAGGGGGGGGGGTSSSNCGTNGNVIGVNQNTIRNDGETGFTANGGGDSMLAMARNNKTSGLNNNNNNNSSNNNNNNCNSSSTKNCHNQNDGNNHQQSGNGSSRGGSSSHSTGMLMGTGGGGSISGASIGSHSMPSPESLVTYNDDEEMVTFNIEGKSVRLGIHDALPFLDDGEYGRLVERGYILNANAPPLEENASWAKVQVPEACVQQISDYNVPDAPPRPLAYYRFIEKSVEELDGEIEYDVDEEDSAWLEWINNEREKNGYNVVSIETMELLMDRLEKESYFQSAANGSNTGNQVDDDAVCCICMDGECQNTNVILFCDMCNLAVHQDCYGVPYIPEGQWLCRRCLQSPSTPVNCVLCPNTGGAFKQTDRRQWAHVVCALWIPEVRFANTVFLEPIDSIEMIPPARWRLTCYVCKEKGLGACIQCHRNSCYAAFHVTCAQQAGLYMTMDMNESANLDSSVHVQKYAFCHSHTPEHAKSKLNLKDFEDARHKMKEARKALAKKRSTAPIVLIPTIPSERIQEISTMVQMQKKKEFIDRLVAYWTLKRKYRNGVPLLRRLQSQGNNNNHAITSQRSNGIDEKPNMEELYNQLKYWQCLRQDLERARLLCELVRKREKLKASLVKLTEQTVTLQLNPLESTLTTLLGNIESRDTSQIFREPVNINEVPDYLDIVTHPMDLGTMKGKLQAHQYTHLDEMQADFDLMIQNCLAYNNKDTVFYRAGLRMRDQAAPLFDEARQSLMEQGLIDSRSDYVDRVEQEIERELQELLNSTPSEPIVQKLLILADKSQVLKNPAYRTKKIKQIRLEISRMRKTVQKLRLTTRRKGANGTNASATPSHNSQTEDDNEEEEVDNGTRKSETHLRHIVNNNSNDTNARNKAMEENHNVEDMDVDRTIKSTPLLGGKNIKASLTLALKRSRRRVAVQNHAGNSIYNEEDDDDDDDEDEDDDNGEEEDDADEVVKTTVDGEREEDDEDEDDNLITVKIKANCRRQHRKKENHRNNNRNMELKKVTKTNENTAATLAAAAAAADLDDEDDDDDEAAINELARRGNSHLVQTPSTVPLKNLNMNSSPVGVNRRTAVLFTRKAQAALKRPLEATTSPVKMEQHHHHLGNNSNHNNTINNNNNNNNNVIGNNNSTNNAIVCGGGVGVGGGILVSTNINSNTMTAIAATGGSPLSSSSSASASASSSSSITTSATAHLTMPGAVGPIIGQGQGPGMLNTNPGSINSLVMPPSTAGKYNNNSCASVNNAMITNQLPALNSMMVGAGGIGGIGGISGNNSSVGVNCNSNAVTISGTNSSSSSGGIVNCGKSPKRSNTRYKRQTADLRSNESTMMMMSSSATTMRPLNSPKKSPNCTSIINSINAINNTLISISPTCHQLASTIPTLPAILSSSASTTSSTASTMPIALSQSAAAAAAAAVGGLPPSPNTSIHRSPGVNSFDHIPDKFRVYRTNNEGDVSESDSEDHSHISGGSRCSSCSGFGVSCTGSELYTSEEDDEDEEDEEDDDDDDEDDDDDDDDEEEEEKSEEEDDDDVEEEEDDEDADYEQHNDNEMDVDEDDHHIHRRRKPIARKTREFINSHATRLTPVNVQKGLMNPETVGKSSRSEATRNNRAVSCSGDSESQPPLDIQSTKNSLVNSPAKRSRGRQKKKKDAVIASPLPARTAAVPSVMKDNPNSVVNAKQNSGSAGGTAAINNNTNNRYGNKQNPSPARNTNHQRTTNSSANKLNNNMQTRKGGNTGKNNNSSKCNNQLMAATNGSTTQKIMKINNSGSEDNHNNNSQILNNSGSSSGIMTTTADMIQKPPLEPLQLVWAKCRGYPWYPALILDPKTPKGFVYNGVPLPAPPTDVLALRKNYPLDLEVYLVLFFDVKRTWQWLPANKLEILGVDKEVDQQKLIESRKPTDRKAVKKAYQDALHYQSQVTDLEGQGPDPIM